MKSILITFLLVIICNASAFHHRLRQEGDKEDYTSYELKKAFNVQCRIKLKGTFKLTHLTNDS
jgi:hypothetical protein